MCPGLGDESVSLTGLRVVFSYFRSGRTCGALAAKIEATAEGGVESEEERPSILLLARWGKTNYGGGAADGGASVARSRRRTSPLLNL